MVDLVTRRYHAGAITRMLWLTVLVVGTTLVMKNALVAISEVLEWLPLVLAAPMLGLAYAGAMVRGRAYTAPAFITYGGLVMVQAAWVIASGSAHAVAVAGIGTAVLLFFPIFWIAVYHATPAITLDRFFGFNTMLAAVVAVLGLYQYFVDRSLFGWVTGLYGQYDASMTHRAVSVMGSPQALGIYLALSASYLLFERPSLRRNLLLGLIGFVMLLTGSKAVFVYWAAYIPVYMWVHGVRVSRGVFVGGAVGLAIVLGVGSVPAVGRILEPINVLQSGALAGETSRVIIWTRLLTAAETWQQVVFGHGLGSAERILFNRYGLGVDSAESYLLKLYYEMGLSGVTFFTAAYVAAVRRARVQAPHLVAVFAGFATNLMVVHAFAGLFLAFHFSAIWAWCLIRPVSERRPRAAEAHP